MCLLPKGRTDEALAVVRGALRRDPLSLTVKTTLASVMYGARRYREAIVAARDVASLDPSFAPAHFFLGQSLTLVGEHAEAVDVCRKAVELSSRSAEALAVLCLALSGAGDASGAVLIREELRARASADYVSKGQIALASLALGDTEAALQQLEIALEERATDLIWLGARPVWDPLRHHERFQRVLERLGLTDASKSGRA
jgi:tetratricopeptide (TPR) repeat protein